MLTHAVVAQTDARVHILGRYFQVCFGITTSRVISSKAERRNGEVF